jgi:hypothetical protein
MRSRLRPVSCGAKTWGETLGKLLCAVKVKAAGKPRMRWTTSIPFKSWKSWRLKLVAKDQDVVVYLRLGRSLRLVPRCRRLTVEAARRRSELGSVIWRHVSRLFKPHTKLVLSSFVHFTGTPRGTTHSGYDQSRLSYPPSAIVRC